MFKVIRLLRYCSSQRLLQLGLCALLFASPAAATNQTLSYSGRLTNLKGKPLEGPLDINLKFWSASTGGTELGPSLDYPETALVQGVFQLSINLKPQQMA